MKKLIATALMIVTITFFTPIISFGIPTGAIVQDGETFNVETLNDGDTVTVLSGATAEITGTRNVRIDCEAGVTLTINNLVTDVSGTSGACALSFTGDGNTLILEGKSSLKSAGFEPGIRVEEATQLTIDESLNGGTVTATSIFYGAGIGGGYLGAGGIITINGGIVVATGGGWAAGIGGGCYGNGGTININDGTVTAIGGAEGAGIGGGYDGNGGTISITEGLINAIGGSSAAGIGGGGGDDIGYSNAGTIDISGGKIYADGGKDGQDIGCGCFGYMGNLSISGDAAIFLHDDRYIEPTTTTHTHELITVVENNMVYGISANGWEPEFGIYMNLCTLDYDLNQGTGTLPSGITKIAGNIVIAGDNTNLNRDLYINKGWNTKEDGSGISYEEGDEITLTEDMMLYAEWEETSVELSSHKEIMYPEDMITLTIDTNAVDSSVAWTSSDKSIATVDSSGLVTAISKGTAVITATTEGRSDTCEITVKQREEVVIIADTKNIHVTSFKPKTFTKFKPIKTYEPITVSEPVEESKTQDIVVKIIEGTIVPVSVEEDEDSLVIEIDISDLLEGTTSIELPNGKVIKVTGNDTIKIEVLKTDLDENGNIDITAVNEENAPLGNYDLHVMDEENDFPIIPVLLIIAGLLSGIAIYFILKRRRTA